MLGVAGWLGTAGAAGEATRAVPVAKFQQQIAAARQRVAACEAAAANCNMGDLPTGEEKVTGGAAAAETAAVGAAAAGSATAGTAAYPVRWEWLRTAVDTAKASSAADRKNSMEAAQAHLASWATEVGSVPTAAEQTRFGQVRTAANGVLARGEFRAAGSPSWLDRQMGRLLSWFFNLFTGMAEIGTRNAWLAPLVEWSCFLLAAAGLLYFVRRSLQRQSLRIALGEGAARARHTERDAADWAGLAEQRAAAADWREAIHCLYWAAIASLEARRAWRFNPTRTPREYLRLLRPGSEAQRALRGLTREFERAWYGQGAATESEFRAAQVSFAAIQGADLQRAESIPETRPAEPQPLGGV